MRYINIIGIAVVAMLTIGCALQYKSLFEEDGTVPVNRKLINDAVRSLYEDGYKHGEFADNVGDEEYFEALKTEVRQEYDRKYRTASGACKRVYDQEFALGVARTRAFGGASIGLYERSEAFRAFDDCMLNRGWEAGTQEMYDQIFDLAWQKIKRTNQ